MKLPVSKTVKEQTKQFSKNVVIDGEERGVVVNIRWDDQCANGRNSFSVTATICRPFEEWEFAERLRVTRCADHSIVEKHFPELAKYTKWHLMFTDGPMHYLANTLYHASDRDHNGCLKGEYRSFAYKVMVGGECLFTSRTFYSFRNWLHRDEAKEETQNFFDKIKSELNPEIVEVGIGQPSEGKEPELDAARRSAVWFDAELPDFTKENLLARLPALMNEFKADVEELGLEY